MASMTSIGKSLPSSSSFTMLIISSRVMKPSPSCGLLSGRAGKANLIEDLKARFQIVVGASHDGRCGHIVDELLQRDHAVAWHDDHSTNQPNSRSLSTWFINIFTSSLLGCLPH